MKSLYHIGDRFYSESKTMMSSIYEEGTHARYDWGFVQRDLRNGHTVTIRPATPAEMERAEAALARMRAGPAEGVKS